MDDFANIIFADRKMEDASGPRKGRWSWYGPVLDCAGRVVGHGPDRLNQRRHAEDRPSPDRRCERDAAVISRAHDGKAATRSTASRRSRSHEGPADTQPLVSDAATGAMVEGRCFTTIASPLRASFHRDNSRLSRIRVANLATTSQSVTQGRSVRLRTL